MKKLPAAITLLFLTVAFPQLHYAKSPNLNPDEEQSRLAVTEDGDNVILYSDGTWEYSDEPAEKVERKINKATFVKPETSAGLLKGKSVEYHIWYDHAKWELLEENINENAEYSLLHRDKNCYILIVPEAISLPPDNLRDLVVKNIRAASRNLKILKEEERMVNSQKVIMLNVQAEIQGMTFVYLYYLYSNEKSSMQVIGFTTKEHYTKFEKDMENFLNGFISGPAPEKEAQQAATPKEPSEDQNTPGEKTGQQNSSADKSDGTAGDDSKASSPSGSGNENNAASAEEKPRDSGPEKKENPDAPESPQSP